MGLDNPDDNEKRKRLEQSKREWMAKQAALNPRLSAKPEASTQAVEQVEASDKNARQKQKQRTSVPTDLLKSNNGIRLRDELRRLEKDLKAASLWYSERSGSAGVRRGMTRLEGQSKHRWAYIDERDVSDFEQVVPEPAMRFPFELDEFQKRAIIHIEAQQSVFVAAHTSAGKTVVAEYAIALAAESGGKVFYTSPIKTLSNQKLRDFRGKFKDVGLVTGDVSINEDAQCVIMTTEILRSMLYRSADVIRDVTYVIFDEVQFLNDEERGVVWEESIIMLPPHVSIIMLSATVPNALEFASWVGKTKDRRVAVVATSKRPIPLRHSWLHRRKDTPDELRETLLLEQGGHFQAGNFKNALFEAKSKAEYANSEGKNRDSKRKGEKKERSFKKKDGGTDLDQNDNGVVQHEERRTTAEAGSSNVQPESEGKDETKKTNPKGSNKNKGGSAKQKAKAAQAEGQKGPNSRRSPWVPLVKFLRDNDRTPSVIFCFSKKKCERAVSSLESIDLLPESRDKAYVKKFFQEALVQLREEDRNLPQVLRAQVTLERGISAHHAGLLPIVKEVTEILFSKGLVKILFATETFAMGVNMPARAVVFTAIRKHDGRSFRFLQAGEYTQMSGRAGRRGLDSIGNVHLFFPPDEQYPEQRVLEKVMTGDPITLKSAFRLTYSMILNVLRVDELRVEELMKQSFSEANDNSKFEGISNVLDRAQVTLGKLNLHDGEDDDAREVKMESNSNAPAAAKSDIEQYAKMFTEISEVGSKLTFQDLNPLFSQSLTHGRVVIAEVNRGFLSLAAIFSIVPRGDQRGAPYTVKNDTTVWVAYVAGIIPKAAGQRVPSVLLPLTTAKNGIEQPPSFNVPQVTTDRLLVVRLKDIEASKIVYICDWTHKVPQNRVVEQQAASKELFYKRVTNKWRKPLVTYARELEKIVLKWESTNDLPADVFDPNLKQEVKPAESFGEWDGQSRSVKGKSRHNRGKLRVPAAYLERMKLCDDLVKDKEIGMWMRKSVDRSLVGRIDMLLLDNSIRSKVAALREAKERFHRPTLLPEYERRVEVLRRLDYVGSDGMSVQLKGRCGCNVATTDSVILTEIVLENVLRGLQPAEVASLLSCLVCRAKNTGDVHKMDTKVYSEAYLEAKGALRGVVQRVGKIQEELQVEVDVEFADGGDDYESAVCRWDLAHAIYAWAKGDPFCDITDLTQQQEGDIVVCVKRLIELLRDAQSVSKLIGNDELDEVLEEAITAIRRDVVFHGSLYYQDTNAWKL